MRIHLQCALAEDHVRTTAAKSSHRVPPDIQRAIDAAWKEAQAQPGVLLFDGPLKRLESWRVEDGRLYLELSDTSFKPFLGTNLTHADLADKYSNDVLANPLGLSAALQSADGYLLFGRRSSGVAYHPNRVHPFAGSAVDLDVFGEMRRELAEELALTTDCLTDIRCIGIAEDRTIRQPELIFSVISTRTRSEIEQSLDPTEHTQIVAIRADAPASAPNDWTPIAQATLQLWKTFTRTTPPTP